MIGLVGCAGSTAVVGWIPRLLLQLVLRMQTPHSVAWFMGEDTDPHAAGKDNGFLSSRLNPADLLTLFVSASYQTGLDTRSMTRRSIIVGGEGRGGWARAKTWTLLDYACHNHLPEGGPAKARSLSASNLSLTLNTKPSCLVNFLVAACVFI